MEIWGGNLAIDRAFAAPGLNIWVHSTPYKDSKFGGGDIYYLTSCASGRISRFLLADVSGHGEQAADLAISLRDMLRDNVNKINQEQFVSRMNTQFGKLAKETGFATAIVATFFEPQRSLDISVAGHPYPFYYRAKKQRWFYLDPAETSASMENLPLGIHRESNYPGRKIHTEVGDMFLLYSDAFTESSDQSQRLLGIEGVLRLLNESGQTDGVQVIPYLRQRIGELSPGNLADDDATLILGHFTESKVKLRDNLIAPFRLLGKVHDNTSLGH